MTVLTLRAGHEVAGRYLLQEPIGRGGMGVVWRAWDETLRRTVAVKCARPDDEQAARRLKKEAQYAARLHHPNIVPVFDFVEDEGPDGTAGGEAACWIVMEYVPSRSLAQVVKDSGLLSPEDAGSVGSQIAAALAKSHSMGVVHGDVTPENVLVTEDGVARLTDFGIARALWSDVTQTHTITSGVVRGKPKYLAPELAKGRPADEKADVFSLGASLFAAVEGQSPYGEAEHPMAYVARAVEGHLEPAERAGLLTASLSRFGDTELDPDYGELDRCDVLLLSDDGDELAGVEVNFLSEAREFDGSVPVRRVGNIEIASMTRDGDDCERYIATSDRRGIVVIGKRREVDAPDPCALADAATDHAVTVLDRGPVPRRPASWPATSLARLNACALLDTAALKRVPDLRTRPSDHGFADWTCEWASPDGDRAFVRLAFNRDNQPEDNGRPTRIAGTTTYVAPDDEGDRSCAVYAPHRTYTNSVGDPTVELFRLTVHGQRPTEKECAMAEALTATALKNIAEQLPEGT
ncbi:protein kinase [Streptomyces sp. NPDC048581]|uniref:serine/threonine-protein kinase n=1 Tax=Streptomyces sp. NPDC048581 TaxID=3365572 RepID=UPI003710FAFA